MRQRLAAIYVLLLLLVLAALEVPLAISLANRDTERMTVDRLADASRFATLAEPALRTGDTADIRGELLRYDELYDIAAIVIDVDRHAVLTSRPDFDPLREGAGPQVPRAIERALAGEQVGGEGTVWPWGNRTLVVASPVGSGGEVLGAVVTVSPTDRLRAAVRVSWLKLLAVGMLAVVAGIAVASILARWTLKPVVELDATVHRITAGNYGARVPPGLGPPELQRLTVAFNEMADTVTDALERQRAFVAQASHQLRNPLTALRLRVEDLGEELTSQAAAQEHRLALEETERLGDVLDGLLALARTERGQHRLAVVDASATVAARVAAWQPLAAQRRIGLAADPAPPVWVRVVTTGLDQALDALIDNALKFADAGARVRVSVRPADGGADVHVIDDGPGLSDERRARAPERFWRAPTSQNVEGAGLGLPIVAALMEASGGRLDLLPVRPHGLDARLWLPAAKPPAAKPPAAEPPAPVGDPPA
ncbi:sensor histidine kinase [Rhizomonospora bruguierae]|uniref:sensor histidine kinase n=1 Tax=Rhizomonospora bruguierae TaxID=1581705 RepID=UPI001BCB5597|nr:HAMP domain-containing sensor histidine kinase [Micromonospora sp. NBRC 107566]